MLSTNPMNPEPVQRVDYDTLDAAKNAFIAAGRKTLKFAEKYGFVPDATLGGSANVFNLDLSSFLQAGARNLKITLLPEGLGTADDACPNDLSNNEKLLFWRNIAYKTVATMTNDAASSGMQPILLSLYLPSSTPAEVFTPEFMSGFLDGIVAACKEVGCVYFSGETPQLRGKIVEGRLDIAGAVFGILPANVSEIDPKRLAAGDKIVFIESSGPHENGFTTLRALATKLENGYRTKLDSGIEFWQAINAPSKLYTPLVQDILAAGITPSSIEPITGHGWQKLMRSRENLRYRITATLPYLEVFEFVEKQLALSRLEMLKIFNCGVGMAIFVSGSSAANQIVDRAEALGLKACIAGQVEDAAVREVVIEPLNVTFDGKDFTLSK